ncbi:SpoIIE family protein phosphatase [Streptomyces sp. NPDC002870]|uniref:ATP-binding SpoIIE family protein phosphatase n=1 Tax=Streptomyces sp. NPDC002870 TaxID=3364666 RepID=UPI0036C065F1
MSYFTSSDAPDHPLVECRDAELARALLAVHERVRPSAASVYLLAADGSLAPSTILDTPLSFTMTPHIAAGDMTYTVGIAHRSGKPAVKTPEDVRLTIRAVPVVGLYAPFTSPVTVASAPLRTARRRLGVLTARWVQDHDVPAESFDFLMHLADEVAASLDALADRSVSMEAPEVPLYVPAEAGSPATEAALQSGTVPEEWRRQTSSSRYLWQLQQLGIELTAASRVADVIATTQKVVSRPFGGRAVTLCMMDQGRLLVVGSSGASKEDLRSVDRLPLESGAPEADAALLVHPMVFATPYELRKAYPDLDRYHDGRPRAFLPLVSSGRTVGCCIVAFDRSPDLRDEDLAILTTMLSQVGQSLERARGAEIQQEVSRGMQRALLPRDLPHVKGVETTARYLPATVGAEVGGDWYDVIKLSRSVVGMIIGDVEGHNLDAVAIMGQLRSGVRAYATEGHDPASVLTRSNRLLSALGSDLFATCSCMWLDLETGTATLASAGHRPPVAVDPHGGTVAAEVAVGPPMGVDPTAVYGQSEFVVPPHTVAAFFTDGLLNARTLDAEGRVERLRRVVAEHVNDNLENIADRLIEDSDSRTRRDDIALLLTRFLGSEDVTAQVADMAVHRYDVGRVQDVRRFARAQAVDWGLEKLTDELELLVSEIVTNALIHGQSAVDVRIRKYEDRLRVEVRDNEPHPPIPAAILDIEETRNDEAESGRGLLIVDAIASDWGSSPTGRGKTTWFEMLIPAA